MPKSSLNLSIETAVKYAAKRAFAGRRNGREISDEVQSFLAHRAAALGEFVPPQFLSKRKP